MKDSKSPVCPNCHKEYVIRVHRRGVWERFLSLFYIYPFRCQLCGSRFRFLQRGVLYKRVLEDRREYERLPTKLGLRFRDAQSHREGEVSEISLMGCTAKVEATLSPGDLLYELEIQDGNAPALKVKAAVVRNARPSATGLEFLTFVEGERDRLRRYVQDLLQSRKAPRTGNR